MLNKPIVELQTQLDSMFAQKFNTRPECKQVLDKYNEWSIDRYVVANEGNLETILTHLKNQNNIFFYEILQYVLPTLTDIDPVLSDDEPPPKRSCTDL